jgi:hypothetical protein
MRMGEGQLRKAYGTNEAGLADLPRMISNVRISRIMHCSVERLDSWDFPHGREVPNSTLKNRQRSWKTHRRTQHKES